MNFSKFKYKKFRNDDVKILLITSKYFLIGEFINALNQLKIEYDTLILENTEYLTDEYLRVLKSKILEFKPDFAFTINHLGIDREGILINFFEKIELPILSWYVDNPNLIIKYFRNNVSDYSCILVWDRDNIEDLKKIGFKNVYYLPLVTDINRFKSIPLNKNPYKKLRSDVIFVGKSMIEQVNESYRKINAPEAFKKTYKMIGVKFAQTDERSVSEFMRKRFPEIYKIFEKLPNDAKTYFETAVTWEATRIYRYKCVKEIIDFNHLIVGDRGWKKYFRNRINYFPEVNYYEDLPYIYNLAEINFNTTSMQMKNAVNQRVFDVPACRKFLLTDYRTQIEDLFEVGKEVICYNSPEEIKELTERYLKNENERNKIINRAYSRVLKEHKYTDRVLKVIEIAKKVYS